jgi:pyrroline-5-carboxylate reductase
MKLCFIGFGNMAKAIAQSLYADKSYRLMAAAPSLPAGQTPEGLLTSPDNLAFLSEADLVLLALKPGKVGQVLAQIGPRLPAHCLLLSIVAGLPLSLLEQGCNPEQAIVRAMPNLPIALKKGATPLIANPKVSEAQRRTAEALFQRAGLTHWVNNEAELDALTALSGSGPAYVFFFLEALIAAGTQLGVPASVAQDFTLQTAAGALAMATSSAELTALREQVTSPGGTTAAALAILKAGGFTELIFQALAAAKDRTLELRQ